MPTVSRGLTGELAWATAFVAFMGGAQLWLGLLNSSAPRIAAALLLLLLAVGLWGRIRAARRAALVVLAAGAVVQLYQMFDSEVVISRLVWILAPLWCAWVIWQSGEGSEGEEESDADRRAGAIGLVALTAALPSPNEEELLAAATRAFAGRGGRLPSVVGGGQFWAVRFDDLLLRVSMAGRRYVSATFEPAESIGPEARDGIVRHAAWLAVDLADPGTHDDAQAAAAVRRLLAEIFTGDVLAVANARVTQAIGGGGSWRERLDALDPHPPPAPATPAPTAPLRDTL